MPPSLFTKLHHISPLWAIAVFSSTTSQDIRVPLLSFCLSAFLFLPFPSPLHFFEPAQMFHFWWEYPALLKHTSSLEERMQRLKVGSLGLIKRLRRRTIFWRDLEEMEGESLAKPRGSLRAFMSWFGVGFCNQRLNLSEELGLERLRRKGRDASNYKNWLSYYL